VVSQLAQRSSAETWLANTERQFTETKEVMTMGTKGDKSTSASSASSERLQLGLSRLGDISIRKMFGGYGVFEENTMFALVDSHGGIFFKVDDTNVERFEEAGSTKHGRMPYYRVPDRVVDDDHALQEWAQSSITVSRNAK
jgi:DNA transformation protein